MQQWSSILLLQSNTSWLLNRSGGNRGTLDPCSSDWLGVQAVTPTAIRYLSPILWLGDECQLWLNPIEVVVSSEIITFSLQLILQGKPCPVRHFPCSSHCKKCSIPWQSFMHHSCLPEWEPLLQIGSPFWIIGGVVSIRHAFLVLPQSLNDHPLSFDIGR